MRGDGRGAAAAAPSRAARRGVGTLVTGAALAVLVGCGSAPAEGNGAAPGGRPPAELLATFAAVDSRAPVLGTAELPVVGRFVTLRGPADSAWVGFAASLPPAALRFAREGELYAASYQMRVAFVSAGDTVRSLNRREIVRVDDFAETTRTDEAIIFQRFVTLAPGDYEVDVLVRELTTRHEIAERHTLRVPDFAAGGSTLAGPVVAWRAAPRGRLDQPPPLIVAPRSTVVHGRAPALVVVEDYAPAPGAFRVETRVAGEETWSDTLEPEGIAAGPPTLIASLPLDRLPPGEARVRVTSVPDGRSVEAALVVALADQWVFREFEDAADHLRYAEDPGRLEEWAAAPPAERVRRWTEFYRRTDPDPETPANEYLAEYFERMTTANERYTDSRTEGWRSDRGAAYVQLGPPDREVPRPARRTGERDQIEWVYDESLPIRVRLLFEDVSGFGSFTLTQRSRLLLREAVEHLRSRRPGDPEEDIRLEDHPDRLPLEPPDAGPPGRRDG